MKEEALTKELLGVIRREFYAKNDKEFWQDRWMLLQAVTYPAKWLHERGAKVPEARYKEVLLGVVRTIKAHGDLDKVRRFSAYFLHSVQEHLKHQGEALYYEAKKMASIIEDVFYGLEARKKAPVMDTTVPTLAELHRFLKTGGGRKKKAPVQKVQEVQPVHEQGDLFG